MSTRFVLLLCIHMLLAFGVVAVLHAHDRHDQAVLPVIDENSGQIRAWLLLEPEASSRPALAGSTHNAALVNRLGARFGLSAGEHHGPLPMWLRK